MASAAVRVIYFFAFISVILQQSVLSVPVPVHKLEDSEITHDQFEISRLDRSAETENLHLENSAAENQDESQLVLINKATGARPGSNSDVGMRQGRQFGNAFASANANAYGGGYGGYGGGFPGYGFPSFGGSSASASASASSSSGGFYGK